VVEGADEPVTPTYVADALGKCFNTVKKLMWEMSREGQLRSTGNGRYTTATGNPGNPSNPKGRERANSVTEVTEVTVPVTCLHGYPEGEGCYICDPDHPYRLGGGAT
jgi:hypothetical protein